MTYKNRPFLILLLIFVIALFLRTYNLNWDQGFHLHPDERAIVLYTIPLHLPSSFNNFFNIQSPLNPHFFAYGNFPLYLLKIVSTLAGIINPLFSQYNLINLVGRVLSALYDIATLYIIFLLGKKIYNVGIGLLGGFFYAISVLPIQLSHFYAVDTILTFLIFMTLYLLLLFHEKPTFFRTLLIGFFWGLSLTTKDSALVIVVSISMALSIDFSLTFLTKPHQISVWFTYIPKNIKTLFKDGFAILLIMFITLFTFEPYAFIDFPTFLNQTLQQSEMTHNAFTFPYTLQYVGIIPYWYEIKNIILWGQGPLLGLLGFLGILYTTLKIFKIKKEKQNEYNFILLTFFYSYFLVVGHFAVGFMRYMLPIYPLLALYGSAVFYNGLSLLKRKVSVVFFSFFLFITTVSLLLWPFSFLHIYASSNTRVQASYWINQHIPYGSVLAIEHWDDSLPLWGKENYTLETLPLYNPDTPQKWQDIAGLLRKTNYIIIASNRLYTPLQKLTNCKKLPALFCYTQTAVYYHNLFNGKLGFREVAEFSNSPLIPFTNISINDQGADESFTVYDHPKVMIFKKYP